METLLVTIVGVIIPAAIFFTFLSMTREQIQQSAIPLNFDFKKKLQWRLLGLIWLDASLFVLYGFIFIPTAPETGFDTFDEQTHLALASLMVVGFFSFSLRGIHAAWYLWKTRMSKRKF